MEELGKIVLECDELSDTVTVLVRKPKGEDMAAEGVPPRQCKLKFSRQVAFIPSSLENQITYAFQYRIRQLPPRSQN